MTENLTGIIIEESLEDKSILKKVKILKTEVEKVTEEHKTPWLNLWTMHTIEIKEADANTITAIISKALDSKHKASWYADFKNNTCHYIIFKNKVFKVNRSKPTEYQNATKYGLSLGIPEYQLDFSPDIQAWQRN